jgi:hypothetical protein
MLTLMSVIKNIKIASSPDNNINPAIIKATLFIKNINAAIKNISFP